MLPTLFSGSAAVRVALDDGIAVRKHEWCQHHLIRPNTALYRELALINIAIDSKLRGCHLVKLEKQEQADSRCFLRCIDNRRRSVGIALIAV